MKLNRLNDVFFKYLLGDMKRKTLTLSFINSILNRTEDNLFTDLDFLDKELTPIAQEGKVSVLDIRARMNDGTQVNIEVQVCKDPDMAKRSLYYWSRMYSGGLHQGDTYNKLMQAISINLMDFNAFPNYTTCHHSYHICHDETHDRLLDDLEMHFIELEKIRIGDIRKLKKSEQWIAYFSNQCSDEEREVLAMSEPAIKEAMRSEMYFTQDEKLRRKYEIQEKARRDYISMMENIRIAQEEMRTAQEEMRTAQKEMRTAQEEARLAQEKARAVQENARIEREETVLGFLREGLSYDMISRAMKIPVEQIEEIAKKQ